MPQPSTFRNHDPLRLWLDVSLLVRAGGPYDPAAPRRLRGGGAERSWQSDADLRAGTPGRSTRVHGRTAGAPRTRYRNGHRGVIGSPVDLNEVEELDAATIWPHPRCSYVTEVCGAPALPPKGSERQLRALRFFRPTSPLHSTGIGYAANFTPGPGHR